MDPLLFTVFAASRLWFALPLVVSVSLVYAATRHENMGAIFRHAFRVAVWIIGFMLVVFVIIWLITSRL